MTVKKSKRTVAKAKKSAPGMGHSGRLAGVTFRMLPAAEVKKAAGDRWATVVPGKNSSVKRIKTLYKTAGYDPIAATSDGVVIVKPPGKPRDFTVQRLEKAITGVRGRS
ncbi:hypothetical protein [Bradyrhizobium sp. 33ap4]|uniref:hypothetical protein n=1 Tax=Bradyrhizobium sp. 33ap4 TaxID=3061630 RepID=UPI00292EDC12|nr:hypothetical protein [Bradyrhizobium sp. 33ap4]